MGYLCVNNQVFMADDREIIVSNLKILILKH